jgi:hypothetical protein
MKTIDRIRKTAEANGWTILARKGDEIASGPYAGRIWEKDVFGIGEVHRTLRDGTPQTSPEHEITVCYYNHNGAVMRADAITFTPQGTLYRNGIFRAAWERDKADRIIAALQARNADIPREV